jgi:hypothetical protein
MAVDNVKQSPFPTMQPGDHLGPQFDTLPSSPGLAETQQAANEQVPHSVVPSSSGNGMSAEQYEATLAGAFPTDNGVAKNQYAIGKFSMQRKEA